MSKINEDYEIGEKVKWSINKFKMVGCFISINENGTLKVFTHTINGQFSGKTIDVESKLISKL